MTWQSGPATADGRVLVRDPASHHPYRRRWHAVPAHVLPRLAWDIILAQKENSRGTEQP